MQALHALQARLNAGMGGAAQGLHQAGAGLANNSAIYLLNAQAQAQANAQAQAVQGLNGLNTQLGGLQGNLLLQQNLLAAQKLAAARPPGLQGAGGWNAGAVHANNLLANAAAVKAAGQMPTPQALWNAGVRPAALQATARPQQLQGMANGGPLPADLLALRAAAAAGNGMAGAAPNVAQQSGIHHAVLQVHCCSYSNGLLLDPVAGHAVPAFSLPFFNACQ